MGLSGVLVKRVFSRSRSSSAGPKCHEKNLIVDRSRWSSIRLYLCGDEFNSVTAEDDLTSYRCSGASTMQPVTEPLGDDEDHEVVIRQEDLEKTHTKQEDSWTESSLEEHAAIAIQSAFRGFLVRQQNKQQKENLEGLECGALETTSIEVQIGDSVCTLSIHEESITVQDHVQRKARSQVFKPKEDWDDSTLSSSISKLRIQNKLEATTRRERALAYAFSQQLRTCMTKKRSAQSQSTNLNVGWSWLERWMATRQQELTSVDDSFRKQLLHQVSSIQRGAIIKKKFDVGLEEKESCGSNDVSLNFDGCSTPSQTPRNGCPPTNRRKLKTMRSASRRKSMHCSSQSSKISKREHETEAQKEKRSNQGQNKSIDEIKARLASEAPSDY
ncbi:protein IQ-DOMAIN 1 [Canna indica]|uniref:Protein IQ-DOMAIN 1 n=1 Tax=Canna indica TaxID=4628 RepID=A0AAQ3KRD0_9LILI|nr:protein IQ-DOMAIN 1 [Canna indica]